MFRFEKTARVLIGFGSGVLLVTLAVVSHAEPAGHYGYGEPATEDQIAGWDIDIRPDGTGLPEGSGSVDDGMNVFETQCSSCHGAFGEGMGRFPKLAGGDGSLAQDRPEKTVGSYWPYASTLWDYIHRAMPFFAPQSLTDDQVYALTAYVLNLNYIVDGDFVANKDTLPKVKMPNEDGFIWEDPRPRIQNERCMKDCRGEVEIKDSAVGKNLTPSTTGPLDEGLTE
ncbi:cytochrome c [Marinobacter antarcticus]|uniref:Cytochrome c n=1 Tax=Marinobacter antarcticus TaxID=564117 RepID=A0A1M6UAN1_9GAMM|nr:cytochrome c [Marinobacter antarcticus]SHK66220.1 cytochrome c [Marinobacter antarcticus]